MTLENPLHIRFRGGHPRSEPLEAEVRLQAGLLERFCERLQGCTVVIEPAGRHHRTGKRTQVSIRVLVPGQELVVGRHPAGPGHEDPLLAVRDAFKAMRRQLQDYVRRVRGQVKPHFDAAVRGRVARIGLDHGFIESFEGREVYFHRNSVINADFDELVVGMEIRFEEEQGEEGPQASTVAVVARPGAVL